MSIDQDPTTLEEDQNQQEQLPFENFFDEPAPAAPDVQESPMDLTQETSADSSENVALKDGTVNMYVSATDGAPTTKLDEALQALKQPKTNEADSAPEAEEGDEASETDTPAENFDDSTGAEEDQEDEPSELEVYEATRRRNVIRAGIVGGALLVSAALGIGISSLMNQEEPAALKPKPGLVYSGDPQTEAVTPLTQPETEIAPPSTPAETAPGIPSAETVDDTTGVIRTGRVLPTDKTITATRPNGDVIEVPEVRAEEENDALLMESLLANMAGYLTTEDPAFLDQLTTTGAAGQGKMLRIWEKDIEKDKEKINHPNFQVSIYDDPNDPVRFTRDVASDGTDRILLQSGTLYLVTTADFYNKGDWQAPSSHPETVVKGALTTKYKFDSLQAYIIDSPEGKAVYQIHFEYSEVPPTNN